MSAGRELTFGVEFRKRRTGSGDRETEPLPRIPRIARLMALAIRFDELVKTGEVRDYAALARLGRVTRTRMTQIMKLVYLAPDIQEQLLFMSTAGLTERGLRQVVRHVDWDTQREIFRRLSGAALPESCSFGGRNQSKELDK